MAQDEALKFVCQALKSVCVKLSADGFTREQINSALPQMVSVANQWLALQRAAPPSKTVH
jgi:hypothetical protein